MPLLCLYYAFIKLCINVAEKYPERKFYAWCRMFPGSGYVPVRIYSDEQFTSKRNIETLMEFIAGAKSIIEFNPFVF